MEFAGAIIGAFVTGMLLMYVLGRSQYRWYNESTKTLLNRQNEFLNAYGRPQDLMTATPGPSVGYSVRTDETEALLEHIKRGQFTKEVNAQLAREMANEE